MELHVLEPYPEKISNTAEAITKSCRKFIDLEKNNFRQEILGDIFDEQEYLEKKSIDIQSAGSELKQTLKRFMFLSPRSHRSSNKKAVDSSRTVSSEYEIVLTDEEKIAIRQRFNQESPI